MIGKIKTKLRPVKLAFLVNPKDKKSILEVIKINSCLWGGIFNPIIPAYSRIPKSLKKKELLFKYNASKLIDGYIEGFDPDVIVKVGNLKGIKFNPNNREVITVNNVLNNMAVDGMPNYGIGLFEVLSHFYSEEFKYQRIKPLDIVYPIFKKNYELFFSSVFGSLPKDIAKLFIDNSWKKELDFKDKSIEIENYVEEIQPGKLFLRRLMSSYLKNESHGGLRGGDCIFFLDVKNNQDIIDYWNLRAVGWEVVPIALQSTGSSKTKQFVLSYIKEKFYKRRYPANYYNHATFMTARSVDPKISLKFIQDLSIPDFGVPNEPKIIFNNHYPRIWDEWARDKDGVDGAGIIAKEEDHDIPEEKDFISFPALNPDFDTDIHRNGDGFKFVNEVQINLYGTSDELYAEVIPEGDENLSRVIGGLRHWRFSKRGMMYMVDFPRSAIHLNLPKSEDLFTEWMKSKGWEIKPSPSGLIAKQMLKRLNGISGVNLLSHEGVVTLLALMENGKTITKDTFWAEVQKIASAKRMLSTPSRIAQWILKTNMVRLGIEVQCPICGQYNWFFLKDSDYEVQCGKCLENFALPTHSPNEIVWSYRTFGPFSLRGKAYGVYSVLLVLRFFGQLLDSPITPALSYNLKKNGQEFEVDLGMFLQQNKYGLTNNELIFCECKSYHDNFEKKDIDRMAFLAANFPGAIIVFATLRRRLSDKEKKLITPLVNRGRKYWKSERPYNPVLILTGNELFSDWAPPDSWKDLNIAPAGWDRFSAKDLVQLSDYTQQMYLGLNPWMQWLDEKRQKKKKVILTNPLT